MIALADRFAAIDGRRAEEKRAAAPAQGCAWTTDRQRQENG
jgi:hypothetical protein